MNTSHIASNKIINQLKKKFPGKKTFDLDGRGKHFICEVEPTQEHPSYDRAIEVIISSLPHKHIKVTQQYTILSGTLMLYLGKEIITLHKGEVFIVKPNTTHWAKSKDGECWVEIYSTPGWTKEDHIPVTLPMV